MNDKIFCCRVKEKETEENPLAMSLKYTISLIQVFCCSFSLSIIKFPFNPIISCRNCLQHFKSSILCNQNVITTKNSYLLAVFVIAIVLLLISFLASSFMFAFYSFLHFLNDFECNTVANAFANY